MENTEWLGLEVELEKQGSSNTTSGTASTPTRKRGRPAKLKVPSPSEVEKSPINTSAKDTEQTDDPSNPQDDILFVSSTESDSPASTASMPSLSGFVTSGYPTITDEQLQILKPLVLRKLRFLSKSKGITLQECIAQSALFLSQNNANWLNEAPLDEALEFYSLNWIIVSPQNLDN